MASKRTSHAVYETKYPLVWAPTYRKGRLRGALRERVEGLLREIAQDFGFAIETLAVAGAQVHLCLDFPPRYSIAKVVGILQSISASQVFEGFPQLRKQLWARELQEEGYFARTVGDKVTAEVIRRYLRQPQGEIGQQRPRKLCQQEIAVAQP